jgi:hypothetical protein
VDARSDWMLHRRDATTDFYSLSDEVSLPLPPTHQPTKAPRALSGTCATLGCDLPHHKGNVHTLDPFPYCGKTCALATIAAVRADTTARSICKRPGCGRLGWFDLDRPEVAYKFCGHTCSRLYGSVQARKPAPTAWDFISAVATHHQSVGSMLHLKCAASSKIFAQQTRRPFFPVRMCLCSHCYPRVNPTASNTRIPTTCLHWRPSCVSGSMRRTSALPT